AYKNPKRALLVIFSDPADTRATKQVVNSLAPLCPPHLPLFITFSDPEITNMAHRIPSNAQEAYEKGMAHRFLRKRAEILAGLKYGGGVVLDSTPDEISIQLINQYLQIKSRMQL
ncbi:MAG: hypothetical protein J7M18_03315, partial [Candidatus Eremiobacteraeota bacterium]|nr:hypothetical protein [Candidatus Eremiobacteraeota bacterium]